MSPPKVRFLTKIYHPNIGTSCALDDRSRNPTSVDVADKLGRICLDILKGSYPNLETMLSSDALVAIDKWSPALQIRTVLLSIQALLSAPNPDDPLATDVAKHYKENEKDAQRVSREWTERYASG